MNEKAEEARVLWKDAERAGLALPLTVFILSIVLSLLAGLHPFLALQDGISTRGAGLLGLYFIFLALILVTAIPFIRGKGVPVALLVLFPFLFLLLSHLILTPKLPEPSDIESLPFLEKVPAAYRSISDLDLFMFTTLALFGGLLLPLPFLTLASVIAMKEKRVHKKLSYRLLLSGGILLLSLIAAIQSFHFTLPYVRENWLYHVWVFPLHLLILLAGVILSLSVFKFVNIVPELDERGSARLVGIMIMALFSILLLLYAFLRLSISYVLFNWSSILTSPAVRSPSVYITGKLTGKGFEFVLGGAGFFLILIILILSSIPLLPHLLNHLRRWRISAVLSVLIVAAMVAFIETSFLKDRGGEALTESVMKGYWNILNSGVSIPEVEAGVTWGGREPIFYRDGKVFARKGEGGETGGLAREFTDEIQKLSSDFRFPLLPAREYWDEARDFILAGAGHETPYEEIRLFLSACAGNGFTRFDFLSSLWRNIQGLPERMPIPNIFTTACFIFDDPFSYDEVENLLPEVAIEFDAEKGAIITTPWGLEEIYIPSLLQEPDYFEIRDALRGLKAGKGWMESVILVPSEDMTLEEIIEAGEFIRSDELLFQPLFPDIVLPLFPWEGFPREEEFEEREEAAEEEMGVSGVSYLILDPVDKSMIDEVIRRNLPQIRYCYQRELPRNPTLTGSIVMEFEINAQGDVNFARIIKTTLKTEVIENCIEDKFRKFRFPPLRGGATVLVRYPFTFRPVEE